VPLAADDWFLYKEDDVLIPVQAMRTQARLAERLYNATGRTLGFVRVVYDSDGTLYLADMRRMTPASAFFELPRLGHFGAPTNGFAGAWAYPHSIMKEFVKRPEWHRTHNPKDIRASAASGLQGCTERARILGLDTTCHLPWACPVSTCHVITRSASELKVYHLTRSGKYYVRLPTTGTTFKGSMPLLLNNTWQGPCVCPSGKTGATA
jgi:hypothetical protein